MEALNELCDFLKPDTRLDIKTMALHHLLSMTGHIESRALLLSHPKALNYVIILAFKPDEQKSVSKDAFFTLINLSADELDANVLINKNPALVRLLVEYILDENSRFADTACAVLSNLSRGKKNSEIIFKNYLTNTGGSKTAISFDRLLQVFCTENYNKHKNNLDYLAPFICNLTQLESVREVILNDLNLVLRLLPYTTYMRSTIRRGGIIGSIKNLCFNYDLHESMLKRPEIDILSRLLLPLAGPEEFDSDEMDKLPEDLQYLPPDKEREPDPDVRIMLIETIMMLTSHGSNRDYIKEKNAYVILRELHKWEKDENAKLACEKLVHILIADEPDEASMRDLHQVQVPEDLAAKFYQYDELEKNFD